MYEITVEREFCAAHALEISGQREARHGHNWHVWLTLGGPSLDSDGLLCDFHTIDAVLKTVLAPFQNADLNETPPFDRMNPSAEHVAQHIAAGVREGLGEELGAMVRVLSVTVSEATGCRATYRAGGDGS